MDSIATFVDAIINNSRITISKSYRLIVPTEGAIMKKLWLVLSLVVIGLSGCYVRGHDEGYHRDRDHDEHRNDRGGEHGDHR